MENVHDIIGKHTFFMILFDIHTININNANLEGVGAHVDARVVRILHAKEVRLVGSGPPDVPLVVESAATLPQKGNACTMLNPHTHNIATIKGEMAKADKAVRV